MTKSKFFAGALLALASVAALATPVSGSLVLNSFEHNPSASTTVTVFSPLVVRNQTVGGMNASFTAPSLNGGLPIDFVAFCIDLTEGTSNFGVLNSTYSVDSPAHRGDDGAFSSLQTDRLGKLFNRAGFGTGSTGSGLESGALQLAIWEVVYDSGASFGSVNNGNFNPFDDGNFRAQGGTSGLLSAANGLLAGLDSDGTADGKLYSFNSNALNPKGNGKQDMIAYSLTSTFGCNEGDCGVTTNVPEPSSYALMLAGLGALVFTSKRRKTA